MKKIFIYAFTAKNLGDDLFIKILCERYKQNQFYIFSSKKYDDAFKNIENLNVIRRIPYIDSILRKVNINFRVNNFSQKLVSDSCDLIVNIGGSIFIQSDNWENKLNNFKSRIRDKKPYLIIGSNFGPYNNDEFLRSYKNIFKSVSDICVRDKYSYNLLKNLENVRYAPDVVFTYDIEKNYKSKKQILISVIDLSFRTGLKDYQEEYLYKMAEIATFFAENGFKVLFMGFCKTQGDNMAIDKIKDIIDDDIKNKVNIYNYSGNIDEAVDKILESKYVIATRFHSMILGFLFKKVVFPIIYSQKTLNVINDINFDGMYSKIEELNNVKPKKIFKYFLNSEPIKIDKYKENSTKQFKILDDLLDQKNKY